MIKRTILTAMTLLITLAMGCDDLSLNATDTTPELKARGMVYILPGIQGVDSHYTNIRNGLRGAGLQCAIMIHPWGSHIPGLGMLTNETDTQADRDWGHTIATDIMQYQQDYPGTRIYIIGQSGGGGVSVFTAEALAGMGADPIDGLILLDASLSADYNLSTALSATTNGIVNFYNLDDTAMLETGTGMFGNVDGGHGDSAGRTGLASSSSKVFNVQIRHDMIAAFADPHFADTSSAFTTRYIAPWILERTWPPHTANAD
jgi:hypothetical protein